jgi:ADP-heptose:LPS heptosyltransferase
LINRILFQVFYVFFRLLSRFYPSEPKNLEREKFKNILVFSAAGIGDTLTDSVAIQCLKQSFPKATITVVTHRRRCEIVRHNPFADKVVLYHKSLIRFITLTLSLRKQRPDVIIMLRGNDPDLWPMAYLVNRHAVVSCPMMTRFKFLISHPVEIPDWDHIHGVEQTLRIAKYIGANSSDLKLVYKVTETELTRVKEKLENPMNLVVFQVGGGRRSSWRDWPITHFIDLGKRLMTHYQIQLVLLGGPDLIDKAEKIHEALGNKALNLVGKLSLVESAALLSLSKILVSTDTGIMHLGFAVGVDTLALIHCNNPASRVGPYGYGEKHQVAQLEAPPGVVPSKSVDMALLTPDQVWPKLSLLCNRQEIPKSEKFL